MKLKKGQKLIANISNLNIKGFGIAKLYQGSKTYNIAVDGAFPGDLVECQVYKSKKLYAEARVLHFLKYSRDRVEPNNDYAGISGATPLETLAYPKQLVYKQAEVIRILNNLNLKSVINPIIGMEDPWFYRNKMQYSFGIEADTFEFTLGLHHKMYRSKIVSVQNCNLCDPLCNKLISFTKAYFQKTNLVPYNFFDNSGLLRNLTLRFSKNTTDKMLILELSNYSNDPVVDQYFQALQATFPEITSAYLLNIIVKKGTKTQNVLTHKFGQTTLQENLHLKTQNLEFQVLPLAFFQPNTKQAQTIYQTVLDLVEPGKLALDLFCGTGTIGLFLSSLFSKVVGIELEPQAVEVAKSNALNNQLQNIEFYCGDVYKILNSKQFQQPDLVVVDPPRSGLTPKALDLIVNLAPKQLVYVSCNLKSFANNAVELTEKGYKLELVTPVDQFPHTRHLEVIAKFTRPK